MIITTGVRPSKQMTEEAKVLADNWNAAFENRGKRSFSQWLSESGEIIYVVGKTMDKIYHPSSSQAFFFHPSMSWIRVRRLMNGLTDPLINAMNLKRGMRVCDATMGFGSDAIVASYVTGKEGFVTGVEKNPYIARIVKKGLNNWMESDESFNHAMRKIKVTVNDSLSFLKEQPDKSFDVVYFDPMFEKEGVESVHLNSLRPHAHYGQVSRQHLNEALRSAKHRVVIKSSYPNSYYEELGFTFIKRRSSSSFRYGIIEK